jgi:hypothetical protein
LPEQSGRKGAPLWGIKVTRPLYNTTLFLKIVERQTQWA